MNMKNIALIFAGGTGQRMNSKSKPKQFLELHEKPILVYTLERFQDCDAIDGIVLVSLKDWIGYCYELVERYKLSKVKTIVAGGSSGQESIYNGLCAAGKEYPDEAVVLIHDGVRPLINEDTILRAIDCTRQYHSAITVTPAIETITTDAVDNKVGTIIDRSKCMLARAPQCFYLSEILEAHNKAIEDNLSFIDSASMMQHYGHDLYTVVGPVENIKITTPEDFYIFRAMIDAKENKQFLE